ncbi:MAG: hypothetical protein QOJ30_6271, partial [Pseudonocardiales bacterium]|nr:hypothetical protein [Pseudonocardiales bacterium]
MPMATIAVAAATGTPAAPDSWFEVGSGYLIQTVVIGALAYDLWEQTVWTGFLQSRLLDRHGLLRSALLTAPLFVAIHIPLGFAPRLDVARRPAEPRAAGRGSAVPALPDRPPLPGHRRQ